MQKADDLTNNTIEGLGSFVKKGIKAIKKRIPLNKLKQMGMTYIKAQFPFLTTAQFGYEMLNELGKKNKNAMLNIKTAKALVLAERGKYLKTIAELRKQIKQLKGN